MNLVEKLDFFGTEAKEIPCIKGNGAPTESTEGAVGCFYMDVSTGDVYKCTDASDGVFTWDVVADEKLIIDRVEQLRNEVGEAIGMTIEEPEPSVLETHIIDGEYLNTNAGVTTYAGSQHTSYIAVTPGDRFYITGEYGYVCPLVVEHDKGMNIISYSFVNENGRIAVEDEEYVVPKGVWYVIFNTRSKTNKELIVKKAGVRVSNLHNIEQQMLEMQETTSSFEGAISTVDKMFTVGKNLYNPANDTFGKRVEIVNGVLGTGADGVRNTEWIAVEPSTTYFISHVNEGSIPSLWIAEKDIDDNLIRSTNIPNIPNNVKGNGAKFTTDPNTSFIKCSPYFETANDLLPNMMIEKSTFCTDYEPYKKVLNYKTYLHPSMQNPWIGKKLVVDGDSITHAYGPEGVANNPNNQYFWQFVAARIMGMALDISRSSPFASRSETETDLLHTSKQGAANGWRGIGGSTISNEAGCNDVDVAVVLRYPEYPDDADLVLIAAGTNDWAHGKTLLGDSDSTDITTFNGALNVLLPGLKEKYPTIPIVMMTPIKRGTRNVALNVVDAGGSKIVDDGGNEVKQTQKQFVDAMIEKCREYGVYCLDMWSNCRLDPNSPKMVENYFTIEIKENGQPTGEYDLVHPGKAGHEVMGKTVAGFLKTIYP